MFNCQNEMFPKLICLSRMLVGFIYHPTGSPTHVISSYSDVLIIKLQYVLIPLIKQTLKKSLYCK